MSGWHQFDSCFFLSNLFSQLFVFVENYRGFHFVRWSESSWGVLCIFIFILHEILWLLSIWIFLYFFSCRNSFYLILSFIFHCVPFLEFQSWKLDLLNSSSTFLNFCLILCFSYLVLYPGKFSTAFLKNRLYFYFVCF